jgi:hypothetical protein
MGYLNSDVELRTLSRMPYSGMWHRVDIVWTDVSEEHITSILTVEKSASEELQPLAHAGNSLADFSTVKMEVIRFSVTSIHTRSTRCHIPQDGILQRHHRENLKSYIRTLSLTPTFDFYSYSLWSCFCCYRRWGASGTGSFSDPCVSAVRHTDCKDVARCEYITFMVYLPTLLSTSRSRP